MAGKWVVTGTVLTGLLASGCANERRVSIDLPLSRLESPEAPVGRISGAAGTIQHLELRLTGDQTQSPPDPATANFDPSPESSEWLRMDLRLASPISIGAVHVSGVPAGRVKWHVFGPKPGKAEAGSWSGAVTAAYGRGHDNRTVDGFGGNADFDTRIDQRVHDWAVIVGQRVNRATLVYGGGFHTRMRYRGRHEDSANNLIMPFRGVARSRGLNLGLSLSPSRFVAFQFELVRARADADADSSYQTAFSGGVSFSFWR